MTTNTPVLKTVAQLAQEFISQGCPAPQAFELAGKQFERDTLIVAEQQKQAAAVTLAKNVDGIPCQLRRSQRGIPMPCVAEPTAILVPGGSNAKGIEFGPKLRLYTPQKPGMLKQGPDPIDSTAGSSNSTGEPQETSTWHLAEIVAASSCRLYLPTGEHETLKESDGREIQIPIVEEFTARREEWLKTVREEISMFFRTIADIKAKMPAKTSRRR